MIKRGSDNLVRYVGPVNKSSGAAIGATPGSVVRVYDEIKQGSVDGYRTRLRDAVVAAASSVVVPVCHPAIIENGDTIEITGSKGTVTLYTVNGAPTVTTTETTVPITPAAAVAYTAGTEVRLLAKGTASTSFPFLPGLALPEIGDTVEFELDSGALATATVSSLRSTTIEEAASGTTDIKLAAGQDGFLVLSLGSAPASAISEGRRIRVKLGADLTLSLYGVAVAGADTWGWEATLPDSQVLQAAGGVVRLEVDFNGGANLRDIESWTERVSE